MSRLAPSCPPAQGSCPRAQGLHPHALGIYVVICHFTYKKVFRIPHTTIPNPQEEGSEKARALAPFHERIAPSCPRLAPSWPRHLCCHLSFYIQKGVWNTSYYYSQLPGSKVMRRLAPSCPHAQGLHPLGLGIYVVICHFTLKKVFRIPHTAIPNPQEARL